MNERFDAAVVGAGPAGLCSALLLARAGLKVAVLERSGHPGGRAISRTDDGFTFNLGPHALYRGGPAVALLRELGIPLGGGAVGGNGSLGIRDGRLHTFPAGPVSLLSTGLLSFGSRMELAKALTAIARVDAAAIDEVSLAEWLHETVRHDDGREVLRTVFRVSTYVGDAERFSAGAAVRQLRVALRGVVYKHGGWQTVVDALTQRVNAAGCSVRLHAPVAAVREGEVTFADGGGLRAQAVVLAVEPLVASRILNAGAQVQADYTSLLPVRASCLDVALSTLPRPHQLIALGVDERVYASVHSRWAKLGPEGGALIQLARYLVTGEDGDAAVRAQLEGVLDLFQPGWRAHIVHQRFLPSMTVMHALPTPQMGGTNGRPGVEVPGAPGVFLSGDWVGPEGMLLDAALGSARAASTAAARFIQRASSAHREAHRVGA